MKNFNITLQIMSESGKLLVWTKSVIAETEAKAIDIIYEDGPEPVIADIEEIIVPKKERLNFSSFVGFYTDLQLEEAIKENKALRDREQNSPQATSF